MDIFHLKSPNMLGRKYHKGPNIEEFLLTGDFLSIALITNFLSLKEIFLISLQGKPILGVILQNTVKMYSITENSGFPRMLP